MSELADVCLFRVPPAVLAVLGGGISFLVVTVLRTTAAEVCRRRAVGNWGFAEGRALDLPMAKSHFGTLSFGW